MSSTAVNNEASMSSEQRKKRSQRILAIMFLFPLFIIGAASFVYFTGIGMPTGTISKGTLISPPVQITDAPFFDVQHKSTTFDNPLHQWTFLQIGDGSCDANCSKLLWQARQTRTAMGKYQGKIRLAYLTVTPLVDESALPQVIQQQSDVLVWHVDKVNLQQLFADHAPAVDIHSSSQLFIVDPRGFIMLYYSDMLMDNKMRYKDIIADMKHLLRGQE